MWCRARKAQCIISFLQVFSNSDFAIDEANSARGCCGWEQRRTKIHKCRQTSSRVHWFPSQFLHEIRKFCRFCGLVHAWNLRHRVASRRHCYWRESSASETQPFQTVFSRHVAKGWVCGIRRYLLTQIRKRPWKNESFIILLCAL